jgi:hypothetical protein
MIRRNAKRAAGCELPGQIADESRLDEPPRLVATPGPGVRKIDPKDRNGVVLEGFPNDPPGVDADQSNVADFGPGQSPGQLENPFERNFDTHERGAGIPACQLGQEFALTEPNVDMEPQRSPGRKIE